MTRELISKYAPYGAWLIALLATAGSLMLSAAFHLVPCSLCWYQRIFMFPLVLILGVGIIRRDENAAAYALPLAALGSLVALYHSLLQWGVINAAMTPCFAGAECAVKQINWLGFITIPFMSLLTFAGIMTFLLLPRALKLAADRSR